MASEAEFQFDDVTVLATVFEDVKLDDSLVESEEEFEEDAETGVMLAFAEECDDARYLFRSFMPSKVGGKPAWLNPEVLPKPVPQCGNCKRTLKFLLQVYSPLKKLERAFHRTLFVFVCRKVECCGKKGSLCVLRSQLPLRNKYYSEDIGEKTYGTAQSNARCAQLMAALSSDVAAKCERWRAVHNCVVCGLKAPYSCSQCRNEIVRYCSKDHQKWHWFKSHQRFCKVLKKAETYSDVQRLCAFDFVFPEFELVAESEPMADDCDDNPELKRLIEDCKRRMATDELKQESSSSELALDKTSVTDSSTFTLSAKTGVSDLMDTKTKDKTERHYCDSDDQCDESSADGSAEGYSAEELRAIDEYSKEADFDHVFLDFQTRCARCPAQVIRYNKASTEGVLWAAEKNQLQDSAVGSCERCGGERLFEFQIMPQLLTHLGQDLDWGTLVVYSCVDSCGDGQTQGYVPEFIHFQPSAQRLEQRDSFGKFG